LHHPGNESITEVNLRGEKQRDINSYSQLADGEGWQCCIAMLKEKGEIRYIERLSLKTKREGWGARILRGPLFYRKGQERNQVMPNGRTSSATLSKGETNAPPTRA